MGAMKLLIYAHRWAPETGGVETITAALARAISADDAAWKVTLATRTPASEMSDLDLPFRVVRRPKIGSLAQLVKGADLVHLAGPALLPLILSIVHRKPVVIEHHGFQTICPNGQLLIATTRMPCPGSGYFMAGGHAECLKCNRAEGAWASFRLWALTFARRWLSGRAAANIVPTAWLGTLLRLPRMVTVHHGLVKIEGQASNRGEDRVTDNRTSPTVTFAFNGRLVTTKGVQTLLEAARQLKSRGLAFQLRFVGDGTDRARLEALAGEYQLEDTVRFLGYLSGAPLETALQAADAILMPSLGGEVFGLVALENMMRGKLVVVSDIGALAEVVGDAGLTCATGDVEAWASCMERLIRNPGLCVELGRRARERAQKYFSIQQMIAGHMSVYSEVLDKAR
jgi:glycosyltransferase involved in cell wall biosynthesis